MKSVILVLTMLVMAQIGNAGGVSGGGGKGVLCNGTVRTLDLYEAQELNHLPVGPTFALLNDYLATIGPSLEAYFSEKGADVNDPVFRQTVLSDLQTFEKVRFKDIPFGTHLPLTDDATLPALPSVCSIVQIAIYATDGTIYRDAEYWQRMDPRDQAALILHEAIYHQAKLAGAMTSDQTRALIGTAFAEQLPEPIVKPTWSVKPKIWCGAGGGQIGPQPQQLFSWFAVNQIRDGKIGTAIYFRLFKGSLLMHRISAFIPGHTVEQAAGNNSFWSLNFEATEETSGQKYQVEMAPTSNGLVGVRAWGLGENKPPVSSGICRFE